MLFNKLTGKRVSIVEDTPGVTRDRIYGDCEWCGRTFSLVDTGGIEPNTENDMLKFMRRQAEIGIELADAIIAKLLSKLPGSLMNAVFAFIVAPILLGALKPALKKAGLYEKLYSEIRGYFSYMAERTGTLWEHISDKASMNHGFASHVIYWMDKLGLIKSKSEILP